uniref:Uncharacterized protein n=1 Tax=viral metagenome TaxID=1070528 RepID=A0A6M3K1U6_9ZZZZ
MEGLIRICGCGRSNLRVYKQPITTEHCSKWGTKYTYEKPKVIGVYV